MQVVERANLEDGRRHRSEVRAEWRQVRVERVHSAGNVAVGEELHHRTGEHNLPIPERLRRGQVEHRLEDAIHEDCGREPNSIAFVAHAEERGCGKVGAGRSTADCQHAGGKAAIRAGNEPARGGHTVIDRNRIGMLRGHPVADGDDRDARLGGDAPKLWVLVRVRSEHPATAMNEQIGSGDHAQRDEHAKRDRFPVETDDFGVILRGDGGALAPGCFCSFVRPIAQPCRILHQFHDALVGIRLDGGKKCLHRGIQWATLRLEDS